MKIDYRYMSWCSRCALINPIVRLKCERCNFKVRHNTIRGIINKTYKSIKRYGIAFIPTAIIVVSSLYNIVFI